MKEIKITMKAIKRVAIAGVLITGATALAGQYDDVQYLFRSLYNQQGSSDLTTAVVDDKEFYNALWPALGRWKEPEHYAPVVGARKAVPALMDVVNPLTGRTEKNRLVLHLAQPTYKNAGDDTLYGWANYINATAPFYSNYANDYTILVRFKHEGKICSASTQSYLYDFGYGWGANCGLYVSLRGDDTNQYVYVYLGKTFATEFKAMQNSAATKLSAGKWTDLVIARGGTDFALYTLAEGGTLCKQTATGSESSTQNSNWFRLGTQHSDSRINAANTAIETHAARNNFRGYVARVAMWKRKLTDDEVKAAMADDFAEGDVMRFGVANDSAMEFTGTNYIGTVKATTETDANDANDWRYFVHNLTPANPTAAVKFTMAAEGYVRDRQLSVKLTTGSAAGATLSATLNGAALLTNAAAEPGTTLTADVPPSALKMGDNRLVFTRTDAGAAPLYFDCFAIVNAETTDSGDYRGAMVADDIYADAWAWWKRPNDANGDGKATAGSSEFPNALYANEALKSHATHAWNYDGDANGIKIQSTTVTYPAGGITLENEPCLYFAVPQWTESGVAKYGRADLYKNVFVISNTGNYAFTTRIKVKDWLVSPTTVQSAQVLGIGYMWGDNNGAGLCLRGKADDGDNLWLRTENGLNGYELEGFKTLDAANRLCTNKWIDVAVVVSNGYQRVYTFVEGGTRLVEQNVGKIGGNISTYSRLVLGLNGTSGSAGVTGAYPDQYRGWMHSCALWPRALNRDEVLRAFKYPQRPDLVTIGVAEGTRREFTSTEVASWTPPANGDYAAARPQDLYTGRSYTVNFTIPAEQAGRNQLFRLTTLAGSDPTAKIALELNGETIVNYTDDARAGISEFLPNAKGVYEIGVHREKIAAGAATLTVKYVSGAYPIAIDALSFGNGDRRIKVRSNAGLLIWVR